MSGKITCYLDCGEFIPRWSLQIAACEANAASVTLLLLRSAASRTEQGFTSVAQRGDRVRDTFPILDLKLSVAKCRGPAVVCQSDVVLTPVDRETTHQDP
jgi:hypothetical protein